MADGGNARMGTLAIFGIAVLVNLILSIFLHIAARVLAMGLTVGWRFSSFLAMGLTFG